MSPVSAKLIDDHSSIDKVLKQLQTALGSNEVEIAHAKLDLFWARLAVHIRAEHLHLFPTVLGSVKNAKINHASAPLLDEAQTVVARLHQDHDFFMHELARAIEIMRKLLTIPEQPIVREELNKVKDTVLRIEERLVKHNEVEEDQIYRWASTILNSEEQEKLLKQITTELQKHPSRFTPGTWSGE